MGKKLTKKQIKQRCAAADMEISELLDACYKAADKTKGKTNALFHTLIHRAAEASSCLDEARAAFDPEEEDDPEEDSAKDD